MEALRNAVESESDKEAKAAMSAFLAGGLVHTTSQNDLDFLRSCIQTARFGDDENESAFPAISAALTLGMMGNNDSIELLRRVAKEDTLGSEEVDKAIRLELRSGSSLHLDIASRCVRLTPLSLRWCQEWQPVRTTASRLWVRLNVRRQRWWGPSTQGTFCV